MKNVFTTFVLSCLLGSSAAFAANPPEELSIMGSALNEGPEIIMKKDGNVFELFTSLKTGEYSFTDESVPGGSIQVEAAANEMVPYRITVDFNGDTPIVKANKVISVYLWAPWNQYTITTLNYIGSSQFESSQETSYSRDKWGDERYRIRIEVENETLRTYGASGDKFKLKQAANTQWGEDNESGLKELNFKIDNYSLAKPFTVTIDLTSTEEYTHWFNEPEGLNYEYFLIEGTAVTYYNAESTYKIGKLIGGSCYEDCVTLQPGELQIITDTEDGQFFLTAGEDGKVVESEDEVAFNITEEGVYLIRLDIWKKTLIVEKITELYLWYFKDNDPNKHAIDLTYVSQGLFKGTGYFDAPVTDFDGGNETRHKFTAKTASGKRTFIDRTVVTFEYPREDETKAPEYYKLKVSGDIYDRTKDALRMRMETRNVWLDMEMNFEGLDKISYKYRINESGLSVEENSMDNAVRIVSDIKNGKYTVIAEEGGYDVALYSVAGSCVSRTTAVEPHTPLSTAGLTSGIYIVKVMKNGAVLATSRIVVM